MAAFFSGAPTSISALFKIDVLNTTTEVIFGVDYAVNEGVDGNSNLRSTTKRLKR